MSIVRSEIGWVVEFPVPCENCETEGLYTIRHLVERDTVDCVNCRKPLYIGTKEWTAIRDQLRELCVRKHAPIAKVYKPS